MVLIERIKEMLEPLNKDQKGIAQLLPMVVIFGAIAVVTVIMLVVAAQTWQTAQPQLGGISNANISTSVLNTGIYGFTAFERFASYLPIIAIVAVGAMALGLLGGFIFFGQGGRGRR